MALHMALQSPSRMPFEDADDELQLSSAQLFRLCAEALVLCMPVDLSELSAKDEAALRLVLGGPSNPRNPLQRGAMA